MLAKVFVFAVVLVAVSCENLHYRLKTINHHEEPKEYRHRPHENIPIREYQEAPVSEEQYKLPESHGHAYSSQSIVHHGQTAAYDESHEANTEHVAPVYQYVDEQNEEQNSQEAPVKHKYHAIHYPAPAPVQQEIQTIQVPHHKVPSHYQPESHKVPSHYQPESQKLPSQYQPESHEVPSHYQPETHKVPSQYQIESHEVPSHYQPETHKVPSHYQPESHKVPSHYQPESHNVPSHYQPESHKVPSHYQPESHNVPSHYQPESHEGSTYHHEVPHNAPQLVPHHEVPVHHVAESHQSHDDEPIDYYAYPKYQYEYKVEDPHTGDNKFQHEIRDGDVVKGAYGLHEADGSIRTVEYSSDKHTGFSAIVKHSAPGQHVHIETHHKN